MKAGPNHLVTTVLLALFLLGAAKTAPAQSTWNYFISDAEYGLSLVTWTVTGSLATPPGAIKTIPASSLAVSISAPGIFTDSYAARSGSLATPDGSYFQYENTSVYTPIHSYSSYNAPGNGSDSFGLSANLGPGAFVGITFLYHPGSQFTLLPIDFSEFNPGTYQSEQLGFDTPITVNLTVGSVPEPSAPALFAVSGLCGLLVLRRRKNHPTPPHTNPTGG